MKNCATGKHKMNYAEGGMVRKETADELMARMSAKYGAPSAGIAAPAPQPTPVQPRPVAQPAQEVPRGIIGIMGGRKQQLDDQERKAVGYANGGVIPPMNDMQTRQSSNTPPQQGAAGRIAGIVGQAIGSAVDHPAYNFAQAIPGINIPLSALAYGSHVSRGMTGDAVLDSVSAIPGARAAQMIPRVVQNLSRGSMTANAMRVGTLAQGAQMGQSADALANNYANGGKIKGPGTPTSDSIPAKVRQTGEPINVSTDERIVSHAQNKALEQLAKHHGYQSLDQMLEEMTGKPVGPTIKAGKRSAESGMSPEERAYRLKTGNIAGPDLRGVSSSITSILPSESPIRQWANSGAQPSATASASPAPSATVQPTPTDFKGVSADTAFAAPKPTGITGIVSAPRNDTGFMTGKANYDAYGKPTGIAAPDSSGGGFTQGNTSYNVNPTAQDGIAKITASGKNPLYTNIRPEDAVTGLKNQMIGGDAGSVQEGLDRYARANSIRKSLIDQQPMGGVGILGDGGTEAVNAERTARWRQDDLLAKSSRRNPAAGQVAGIAATGQNQLAAEDLRGRNTAGIEAGRNDVTMRGQDMAYERALGSPEERQLKMAQAQGIMAQTDSSRMMADLQKRAIDGDANALRTLNNMSGKNLDEYVALHAAGGSDPSDPMGLRKFPDQVVVVNKRTGQRVDQAAQPAQAPAIPKAGEVRGGYRFKGGNPADQNAWEKV